MHAHTPMQNLCMLALYSVCVYCVLQNELSDYKLAKLLIISLKYCLIASVQVGSNMYW